MKFIVDSTKLLKTLDNVQGIVAKKHASDILSHICLKAENNKLIINATDTEMNLTEALDAEVISGGSTTASGSLLHETARRLPANTPIEIVYDNDSLTIKCGKFKGSLSCLPVEDFPTLQVGQFSTSFKVKSSEIKFLIEKTRFAISQDETRYFLNGIYLHTTDESGTNVLRSVATDGHRLALAETEIAPDYQILEGIIIPKKAVEELFKLLGKITDKEIEISVKPTRVAFKFENLILTSRLIDGNFPDYKRVIPTENLSVIEANKNELLNTVELISAYSDSLLKAIQVDIENNSMKLTANKSNANGEHILDVKNDGGSLSICFNSRYLYDVCKHIDTENVLIKISDSNSPAIIKKVKEDNEIFVVMPMRI